MVPPFRPPKGGRPEIRSPSVAEGKRQQEKAPKHPSWIPPSPSGEGRGGAKRTRDMTHADLFAGIGGFSLAARWLGWTTDWMIEKDEHCQKRLRKNFPTARIYDDITEHERYDLSPVDLVTGGFPCQPFSTAGKRRGKEDDRHLWPFMLAVIARIRPRYVIAENVAGIIPLELDEVLSSLEDAGYTCRSHIIPACAVGAWHRRDRIWIVASDTQNIRCERDGDTRDRRPGSENNDLHGSASDTDKQCREKEQPRMVEHPDACSITYPDGAGCEERHIASVTDQTGQYPRPDAKAGQDWWQAQSRICGVPDGVSAGLDGSGRQRLKMLGNAIVPQVAYEIMKSLPHA